LQSAFADTGNVGTGSDLVVSLSVPTILVGVGDGIDETSYGWLWHFLTRDLNAPFVPVALRRIGGMDDLAHYNVLFLPDGSPSGCGASWATTASRSQGVGELRRGADRLRRRGAVRRPQGCGPLDDHGVGDSGKPDTTVKASAPPLASPGGTTRDKPEALPGSIFRATLDRTHWLTLGYEQKPAPVYLEGDTFWRQSKNGANPLVFTGDSLTAVGIHLADNTSACSRGPPGPWSKTRATAT